MTSLQKARNALIQGKKVYMRYTGERQYSDRMVLAFRNYKDTVRAKITTPRMTLPEWVLVKPADQFMVR